jgi:hypothetical protein
MRNNLRLRGFDCIIMLIAFLFTVSFGTLEAKVINPDGGFESAAVTVGDDTSGVEGWSFQQASAGLANFVIVDDTVHEGNLALKITINSLGSNAWDIQAVNEPFSVYPGVTYTVTVWARTETGTASANFTAGAPDYSEYGRLEVTDLSPTWTKYTFNFTVSAGQSQGRIPIHFSLTGNVGKVIYLDALTVTGPNFVDMWGQTNRGTAWPIGNTDTTLVGDASIGDGAVPTGWSTIRGGFDPLQATTDSAFVITGQMELVGGGGDDGYTWLRYALTYQDSMALNYQYTDSARWITTGKTEYGHFGYELTPRSGTGILANGSNGVGTVWTVPGVTGWNSTYSGQVPLVTVQQAPRNAAAVAGTYNWAISVQQVSDTTNEIRWYLVETGKKYWFGGTIIDTAITTKFNGICFGFNNDIEATSVEFLKVQTYLGAPINVPEAPFEPFYVDQWGATNKNTGAGWPILNDSSTVVGNAGMGGEGPPANNDWATIRGGFGLPISATLDEAIIVTGKIEWVGGNCGDSYIPIRYALTYQEGENVLENQYTDSAKWSGTGNHYGYEFTPITGKGTMSNGGGGSGTVWLVNDGSSWASTWSNNGYPLSAVVQVPRNAEITEGKYDFGIAVQPLSDGTNMMEWWLVKEHETGVQTTYWWGGTAIDTAQATTQFNGVCFGITGEHLTTINQINLTDVYVNRGVLPPLPPRPIPNYFIRVENWGFYGDPSNRIGGWELTPGALSGNVSISGANPVASDQWASIRGGFDNPISVTDIPADTALVVTGKMQFVGGGFDGWSGLRFGLFYSDSAGVVDSTEQYGQMWTGKESYSSGYLICPNSGTNDNPDWGSSGKGSIGGVVNSTWLSTNGANNFILSDAKTSDVAGAGNYNFKISVKPMPDGTVILGCRIEGDSYLFEESVIDTIEPLLITKFNAINFAVSSTNANTTGLNLTDVQVGLGSPITAIGDENIAGLIPTIYSLSQNYPNPFNPTTTIEFSLPQAGDISLVVYDVVGRNVAELASGHYNAGRYKINFKATNFASGIYFYRLKAKDFVSVKKLILLK